MKFRELVDPRRWPDGVIDMNAEVCIGIYPDEPDDHKRTDDAKLMGHAIKVLDVGTHPLTAKRRILDEDQIDHKLSTGKYAFIITLRDFKKAKYE
jgi:hypothetical protein